MDKERKEKIYIGKIKSIDEENFIVEAAVSDETVDRYGEVIAVDAYKKRLGNYKKHAVLLSSHKYTGLKNQIGKAEDIRVKDGQLIAKFKYFVGEGNEEADWAWKLASKWKMAAYSVGFLPFEWEDADYTDKDVKAKKKPCRTYTDVELLEVSHVLVPANPSALQKSFEEDTEEEIDEVTKSIIDDYARSVYSKLIEEEKVEETEVVEEEGNKDIEVKDLDDNKIFIMEEEMKEVLEAIQGVKDFISERFIQIELRIDNMEKKNVEDEDTELDTELTVKTDDNIIQGEVIDNNEDEKSLEYIKDVLAKATEKLNSVLSVQSS
jgi:hypothetical protein